MKYQTMQWNWNWNLLSMAKEIFVLLVRSFAWVHDFVPIDDWTSKLREQMIHFTNGLFSLF